LNRAISLLLLLALFSALFITPAYAQPDNDLPAFSQVTGEIDTGESQDWTFTAVDGEVVSLIVESTDELDPVVSLISETGALLLQNDDYDYPTSRNAVLQAATIPFTGTYTVRVSGFEGSAGAYQLMRLRGFAEATRINGFTGADDWQPSNDLLEISYDDGQLTLAIEGNAEDGFAVSSGANRLSDYYQQVGVEILENTGGWIVHMTIRQRSARDYYLYSISDGGFWRATRVDGGTLTVLRDWTSHPAIRPGEATFDMGALANGNRLEMFYNGSPVGSVTDDTLQSGVIGFGLETSAGLNSTAAVALSDLVITTPLQIDDGKEIVPEQLILQQPGAMAVSLAHRRAVPGDGEMMLNVTESTVQSNDVGVSRLPLASSTTFGNFALGVDVTVDSFGEGLGGCGLYLRSDDEERYVLAFLDQDGAYGLAERNADTFLPGVFGQNPQLTEAAHQLLVIADENTLSLYVDGDYAGQITSELTEGSIGTAAVNFAQNTTDCTLSDIWLWAW